jgi:hypothetical protein
LDYKQLFPSLVPVKSLGLPYSMEFKLPVFGEAVATCVSGAFSEVLFNLNSCHNFYGPLGSNTPSYFSEIAGLYRKYLVRTGELRIWLEASADSAITSPPNGMLDIGFYVNELSTAMPSLSALMVEPLVKTARIPVVDRTVSGGVSANGYTRDPNKCSITRRYNVLKELQGDVDVTQIAALTGSNPSKLLYGHLAFAPTSGIARDVDVNVRALVTLDVIFFDRSLATDSVNVNQTLEFKSEVHAPLVQPPIVQRRIGMK